MTTKKNCYFLILILASAYNSIYSLAFMKGLYYTLIQSGLGLSHFQLGQLYSSFGLFSMFSYLGGAFFLNRFERWKLLSGSSLIVGILTICLATLPSYPVILIIFGIIGFLIGSTFYPAHLEVLHQIGDLQNQGAVFGMFFVFNSIFGILFAFIGFGISSLDFPTSSRMQFLLLFFALLNFIGFILSAIFLRKLPSDTVTKSSLSLKGIKKLLQNKRLWLVILIVASNYICYSSMNYIFPYLENVFHLPSNINNILSIVRLYCIAIIAAPIAGKITDKIHSASKLMGLSFSLYSITIFIMLLCFRRNLIGSFLCILLFCLFVNMGKSMALITIDEAKIPPNLYGMAISVISFSAYSPDAFYYSLSGKILDCSPAHGYEYIFMIAAVISLLGFITTQILNRTK
ncbi:MAG: MFS transporter [Lachnospiraceae bacterium]|nr:MFS transporter [Lachnospiraceae bacterium]